MIGFTIGFLLAMVGCSGLDSEQLAIPVAMIAVGITAMLIAEGKHYRNS